MENDLLGTCNKCGAVMKMSMCKCAIIVEFSIADHGKVKAFSQALESVICLQEKMKKCCFCQNVYLLLTIP